MENKINSEEQNTQQVGENPVSQPVVTPEKPKINYLMMGGLALVCSLIFGFGGYYLGKQSSNLQQQDINNEQINPKATEEANLPTSSPTSIQQPGSLPTGWSYKDNGECAVKFAIPPKADPYYKPHDPNRQPSVTDDTGSGRFWDFPRGVISPILLSKLSSREEDYKQANAWYTTTDAASGYVSSAVSVSCIPNRDNLNNQSMLSTLKTKLQEYNTITKNESMGADSYTIQTSKESSRWGFQALDFTISEYFINSGGQPYTNLIPYTMYTTPKYIYEITVLGATSDTFVKDTAKKIFDNLSFQ